MAAALADGNATDGKRTAERLPGAPRAKSSPGMLSLAAWMGCLRFALALALAAIKEYIVGLVIKMSASDETLTSERAFVSKLNQILVEVCVFRSVGACRAACLED